MKAFAESLGLVLDLLQRFAIYLLLALVLTMPGCFPLLDRFVFETTEVNLLGTSLKVTDTRRIQGLEVRDGRLLLNGEELNELPDKLARARSDLAVVMAENERLGQQLAEASRNLERLAAAPPAAAGPDRPAVSRALDTEARRLAAVVAEAQQTQAARSEPAPAPAREPAFGIVFGGDRTIRSAMDEVARARSAGPAPVSLWLRQGFWRGLALFETREAARAALPRYTAFRPDAYVVDLRSWCPNVTTRSPDPEAAGVPLYACGY